MAIGLRGEAVPLALRPPRLGHTSGAAALDSARAPLITSERQRPHESSRPVTKGHKSPANIQIRRFGVYVRDLRIADETNLVDLSGRRLEERTGLENRYGRSRPSRVRIPPSPLKCHANRPRRPLRSSAMYAGIVDSLLRGAVDLAVVLESFDCLAGHRVDVRRTDELPHGRSSTPAFLLGRASGPGGHG